MRIRLRLPDPVHRTGDDTKTPQHTVSCAEAEKPCCHSALPYGCPRGTLIRIPVICAAMITGAVTRRRLRGHCPFGAPSGAHSHPPRGPPSHCQRFPLPRRGEVTLLHLRFYRTDFIINGSRLSSTKMHFVCTSVSTDTGHNKLCIMHYELCIMYWALRRSCIRPACSRRIF